MSDGKRSAVVRVMDGVDRAIVLVAQLLLAAMVLLTFASVTLRTFFNSSIPDDLLMQEMLMVAVVFLPLSYVQSVGAHLEVTVLSDLLPKAVQRALMTLGLALGIVAFGWMTYLAWQQALEAYLSGELAYTSVLDIPEWPAKMLVPLGLGWWCLRMMVQLLVPVARPEEAETELRQALEDEKYIVEGEVPAPPEPTKASGSTTSRS